MADINDVCAALAAAVNEIPGLTASPYLLSNPTPPAAEVQVGQTEYDQAFARGLDEHTLIVRVFVAATLNEAAQRRLRRMLATSGPHSVKAAVEADETLGGACADLRVTSTTGERLYSRDGAPSMFGAEWTVQVLTTG